MTVSIDDSAVDFNLFFGCKLIFRVVIIFLTKLVAWFDRGDSCIGALSDVAVGGLRVGSKVFDDELQPSKLDDIALGQPVVTDVLVLGL